MTISWISNVLMNFLDESSGFINAAIVFEGLQGVLIVSVFTANHYGSRFVENRNLNRQCSVPRDENNVELQPINHHNPKSIE